LILENNEKWDLRFMSIAKEIATWSKDPSSQIGAVIVKDRRILGTGYNGFPSGIEDTEERLNTRPLKYPLIIHAELNSLLNCLRHGISVMDATIYIYGLPVCPDCAKSVIQSGINRVVVSFPTSKETDSKWFETWKLISIPMFNEANIMISRLDYINEEHEKKREKQSF
jgi:dCMP deaminase